MEQSRQTLEEEEWGRWGNEIEGRKKGGIAFSVLQNYEQFNFNKEVVVGTFFLIFIRNDHKFECLSLYFYDRPVPCFLLPPSCTADHSIIQYLAFWQSANSFALFVSNWALWLININLFQQYCEFDLMTGNAKEMRTFKWFSDVQLAEWWKMFW